MIQPQPRGALSPRLFRMYRFRLVLAEMRFRSDGTLKPKRTMAVSRSLHG